jgi:hypothetical protein
MSTKVQLPPGCYGLKVPGPGGKEYNGRPGGHVTVDDDNHAAMINKSGNAKLGLITGNAGLALATKGGRRCLECNFLGQAWSVICPRCNGNTREE